MAGQHNIFISHYGEHEKALDNMKARLRTNGCDVRNSSVEKRNIVLIKSKMPLLLVIYVYASGGQRPSLL